MRDNERDLTKYRDIVEYLRESDSKEDWDYRVQRVKDAGGEEFHPYWLDILYDVRDVASKWGSGSRTK